MGRQKNQTTFERDEAIKVFEPILAMYRKLKSEDKEKALQFLFSKVFKNRIKESNYEYGKERISLQFTIYSKQTVPPEKMYVRILRQEYNFLSKFKGKIPSSFLSLISLNLIHETIKRGTSSKDILHEIRQIHELTEFGPEDFKDIELKRKIPLELIDHILKRAEYDLALKALIFRAEQKRLKYSFEEYAIMAGQEWPYYFYSRAMDADTIFQYLYFIDYLKLNKEINKKSAYPPKRTSALECIQHIGNNKDSIGKIYTRIQSILDPDHPTNHPIST